MLIAELPMPLAESDAETPQRFVFRDVDWEFYESVSSRLPDRRVFLTYFKGKLEAVTISYNHERIAGLLVAMVRILAEESDTPICGAGMATLKRQDLDEGAEPDASFYIANELRMRAKRKIDLAVDPPPDMAIEVEVSRRQGERKTIFRDLGIPEIWVYGATGLSIHVAVGTGYKPVDRSPVFPHLSPLELSQWVSEGLASDETAFAKSFRTRVRAAIAANTAAG